MDKQEIKCEVFSCQHCDCEACHCTLKEIKVCNGCKKEAHNKEETICDSYKCR